MAVSDLSNAATDFGAAVSDLFSSQGNTATAKSYSDAAGIAVQNEALTAASTSIQEAQTSRSIIQSLGTTAADVGGAGFTEGGSNLDLLRSSASQGALAKGLIANQGAIQENAYAEQAGFFNGLAEAANSAATGSDIAAALNGIGALANGFSALSSLSGLPAAFDKLTSFFGDLFGPAAGAAAGDQVGTPTGADNTTLGTVGATQPGSFASIVGPVAGAALGAGAVATLTSGGGSPAAASGGSVDVGTPSVIQDTTTGGPQSSVSPTEQGPSAEEQEYQQLAAQDNPAGFANPTNAPTDAIGRPMVLDASGNYVVNPDISQLLPNQLYALDFSGSNSSGGISTGLQTAVNSRIAANVTSTADFFATAPASAGGIGGLVAGLAGAVGLGGVAAGAASDSLVTLGPLLLL